MFHESMTSQELRKVTIDYVEQHESEYSPFDLAAISTIDRLLKARISAQEKIKEFALFTEKVVAEPYRPLLVGRAFACLERGNIAIDRYTNEELYLITMNLIRISLYKMPTVGILLSHKLLLTKIRQKGKNIEQQCSILNLVYITGVESGINFYQEKEVRDYIPRACSWVENTSLEHFRELTVEGINVSAQGLSYVK